MRVGDVTGSMDGMLVAKAGRDEDVDVPAEELVARISEEPLRLRVDEDDLSGFVDDHDRVGRRFEQGAKEPRRALEELVKNAISRKTFCHETDHLGPSPPSSVEKD